MLIKNGKVFLLEEKGFVKRDILIEGKIIKSILPKIDGDIYYDAKDKYIMPGLIEAHSHIGMWEEGIGSEGDDGCESYSPVTPGVRAIDAINPFDEAFDEALHGGVTVACSGPGSANVIGGQFALIKLHGDVIDKMIINPYIAQKCAFGENPKSEFGKKGNAPMTRMGIAYLLRKALIEATNYKVDKALAQSKDEHFDIDLDKEALLKVLDKEVPLKAHVHRADDICTAIRIAKEFDIEMTLDHCTEGHLIAEYIKESGFPAIVGPSFGSRSKIEINKKSFNTVKVLIEKGILTAITTDHNVLPQQSLNMCAAMAVREGLDEFEAIKAITINPATILKIENIKGKLEKNMDADIVVWDKHPLDIRAKVDKVIIEGKEIIK